MSGRSHPLSLDGKAVVVTGAGSGIGAGIARTLADCGATVALWARRREPLEAVAADVAAGGGNAVVVTCDTSDESSVDAAVARTIDELGAIHACVANAGSNEPVPSLEITSDAWHRVLAANLDSAFFTLRSVARHMVDRGGGGSLVAITSLAAQVGQPRGAPYAAAKAGTLAIVRTLAVELARHSVRVNALSPGFVMTPATAGLLEWDRFVERVLPRVPSGRWGAPADYGGAVAYLVSDAAAYHTGDEIVVDGAYSLF